MADKPTIFFHLGLPKTGSTYLQQMVFPYLEGIRYFPKRQYKKFKKHAEKAQPEDKLLFSVEEDVLLRDRMEQLAAYDPHIRVLLVFRRHDDWVASKYKYFIRKHGYANFEEFLTLDHQNAVGGKAGLRYRTKIEWAEELFTHPPMVLIFEDLQTAPVRFMAALTKLTGSRLNPKAPTEKRVKTAYKTKQLQWIRRYNRLIKYQKAKTPVKVWNKIHLKTNQLGVHTVAQLARLAPEGWTAEDTLIPDGALEAVRDEFAEDWTFCKNYAARQYKRPV